MKIAKNSLPLHNNYSNETLLTDNFKNGETEAHASYISILNCFYPLLK